MNFSSTKAFRLLFRCVLEKSRTMENRKGGKKPETYFKLILYYKKGIAFRNVGRTREKTYSSSWYRSIHSTVLDLFFFFFFFHLPHIHYRVKRVRSEKELFYFYRESFLTCHFDRSRITFVKLWFNFGSIKLYLTRVKYRNKNFNDWRKRLVIFFVRWI